VTLHVLLDCAHKNQSVTSEVISGEEELDGMAVVTNTQGYVFIGRK
jgi:hypothetical protein